MLKQLLKKSFDEEALNIDELIKKRKNELLARKLEIERKIQLIKAGEAHSNAGDEEDSGSEAEEDESEVSESSSSSEEEEEKPKRRRKKKGVKNAAKDGGRRKKKKKVKAGGEEDGVISELNLVESHYIGKKPHF